MARLTRANMALNQAKYRCRKTEKTLKKAQRIIQQMEKEKERSEDDGVVVSIYVGVNDLEKKFEKYAETMQMLQNIADEQEREQTFERVEGDWNKQANQLDSARRRVEYRM